MHGSPPELPHPPSSLSFTRYTHVEMLAKPVLFGQMTLRFIKGLNGPDSSILSEHSSFLPDNGVDEWASPDMGLDKRLLDTAELQLRQESLVLSVESQKSDRYVFF